MIIEKITKMDFDKYLKLNIFDVCNMTSTGYYELDRLPAKCANNYIYCEATNDYRTNIFSVDAKGTGAGGAFITVLDIIKFWNGLLSYKLLSKDLTQEMLSIQSGNHEESFYGYGVWIRPDNNIPYIQGSDPGVSFICECNPITNTISVLVSNFGDNVWDEMRKIRSILYEE
jgi:CubicO group peptidase (beta-lactamase class C family)